MENYVKYDLENHKGVSYRSQFGDNVPYIKLSEYAQFISELFWSANRFRSFGDVIEPLTPDNLSMVAGELGFLLSRDERSIIYNMDFLYRQGVNEKRIKNLEESQKAKK